MLVGCQLWNRNADALVMASCQNDVQHIDSAVSVHITVSTRLHCLPVVSGLHGQVEDIDLVIPVGVAGADERQQGKKETKHGCHLLGCPGMAGTLRGRHLAPRKEQERRTCIAHPSTFPREAA